MSARRTFKRGLALVCLLSVCCLNVMALSYVTPNKVRYRCPEVGVTKIIALRSVTCGFMLHPLLYGVISLSVDLLVETINLFVEVQFSNPCKYPR